LILIAGTGITISQGVITTISGILNRGSRRLFK
jgi:C4-type Zn-finger protein